jgi:class 3 adenylate cyclase
MRYHFSPNFERSAELQRYSAERFRGFVVVPPEASAELPLQAEAGRLYRLISVGLNHSQFIYSGEGNAEASHLAGPQTLATQITAGGFFPAEVHLAPGVAIIQLHNTQAKPVGATLIETDFALMERILAEHPSRLRPFLTGKLLLNNQAFREHFPIHSLIPDLRLNVRSLTILFTDLRHSTQLYGKIGDVDAYYLIQNHFQVLFQAVRHNAGAVVKTMGDAVMATFSDPQQGLRAALEMLAGVRGMVTLPQGQPLGLKIGLNEGPALVINAEGRLDYFGQAVNIAARVQELAGQDEICLTEAVMQAPGVPALLAEQGLAAARQQTSLKGIGQRQIVYRLRPTNG